MMKSFWNGLAKYTLLGVLIGSLIGVYQLVAGIAVKFSNKIICLPDYDCVIVAIIGALFLAYFARVLTTIDKNIAGGGVPMIELAIKGKNKSIRPIRSIISMFINSLFSFMTGVGIGSEGPSVYMGGCVGLAVNKLFKKDDKDLVGISCGAGFGCAFLSPFAGFIYIFEEALHKFNYRLILKALYTVVIAFLIVHLITPNKFLSFNINIGLPFKYYYVFVGIIIVNIIVGTLFTICVVKIKEFFSKNKNNIIVRNRIFIMFAIAAVVSVFLTEYRGAGSAIINNIMNYDSIILIILILAFRFFYTITSANSNASGGFIVPMITFGALTGILICNLSTIWFNLPAEHYPLIVLVSTFSMMPIITRSPLTGMTVAISYAGLSNFSIVVVPVIIVLAISYFASKKLTKVNDIYEELISRTQIA